MLKSCLPYLGSPDCIAMDNGNESKRCNKEYLEGKNNNWGNSPLGFEISKQILVRVVHAGGKVEHYPNAVLAGKLLENLPGKWLARPEVFKHPHESIICPEEYLVPGQKYYVIPLSTMEKLKRKQRKMMMKLQQQQQQQQAAERRIEEEISCSDDVSSGVGSEEEEEYSFSMDDYSFCSARDFYVSKMERWSKNIGNGSSNKGVVSIRSSSSSSRSRILLPLAKPKACSGYTSTWEPGLTSIQELSP